MRTHSRLLLPALVSALVASAVLMGGALPAQAAGGSVSVSPNTNVRDRTTVTATGTLTQPAQAAALVVCTNSISGDPAHPENYCDSRSAQTFQNTPAGFSFERSFEANMTLTHSNGVNTVTCSGPVACVVALLTFDAGAVNLRATTPITFSDAPIDDAAGPAGVAITTFRSSQHQTAADPVGSRLSGSPAGPSSLHEQPITGPAPAGSTYLAQDVVVTGPTVTPSRPITLTLQVDASVVPSGQTEHTLQVFRNGVPVRDCANVGVPDPCIQARSPDLQYNGNPVLTVVGYSFQIATAHPTATWNVGTGPLQPADTLTLAPGPAPDYVDGQALAVSGTIRPPFTSGTALLCARVVIDSPQQVETLCGTEGYTADANSAGDLSYSGSVEVHRSVTTIDGSSVTCGDDLASPACVIAYITGSDASDYTVRAYAGAPLVPAPMDHATEVVSPGASVSTHPSRGQNAEDIQGTTVTSPNAGTVTIDEGPASGPPPPGYQLLGQQTTITAPAASVEDPLRLTFYLDPSAVPAGETADSIAIFRDGIRADACVGASGTADQDPCVASRRTTSDGDIEITVLSSHASAWNFGTVAPK